MLDKLTTLPPANVSLDDCLSKAEPVSDGGSTSGITCLRKGKEGSEPLLQVGVSMGGCLGFFCLVQCFSGCFVCFSAAQKQQQKDVAAVQQSSKAEKR